MAAKKKTDLSFAGVLAAPIVGFAILFPAAVADAADIVEIPVPPVVILPVEEERGWHLLGIEAGLSYADLPGKEIFPDGSTTPDNLQTFGLDFAINFASGDIDAENRNRLVVSPFGYIALLGESSVPDFNNTTDDEGGRFRHWEAGVRLENESYINDTFSWTIGGQASYVQMDSVLSNGTQYIERPQSGWRAGAYVGANARLTDHWVMTSRLGYSYMRLNERSGQCFGNIGGPCNNPIGPPLGDQDSELDGFDLNLGLRYEF